MSGCGHTHVHMATFTWFAQKSSIGSLLSFAWFHNVCSYTAALSSGLAVLLTEMLVDVQHYM